MKRSEATFPRYRAVGGASATAKPTGEGSN
jgi:hypothetical protein